MPKMTLDIPKGSPLHERILKKVCARLALAKRNRNEVEDTWRRAEEITLAYIPESETDAVRRGRRDDGNPAYTTIQVPYSYALLMSAHTYWTSVFFARTPIHQFSGRHGEGEQQTQAIEALIAYQVEVGQMMVPYYIWLYDIGKYGHGIIGSYWEKQRLHYGSLVEMPDEITGKPVLYQTTDEVEGYQGNRVYNVSPWDFLHDPRVSLKNFQQGEFCFARKRLGWSQMLRRKDYGYFNENILKLPSSPTDKGASDGSSQLTRPDFGQVMMDEDGELHPAGGTFWEGYIELIPSEWGIGTTNFPQKWCFTIDEDESTIVGASPLGYVHCQFPFDVAENEIEGYGIFSRGIPEIIEPIQQTMDWLLNTHFYNVRASMNNQFIVDPSKLVIKDVQNSGPGFIWRLRPEAFGTDIAKMFMQVPVQDVTKGHMADFQSMLGVGERTLGINDQIMGSLNTGSTRKTATEVRTTTGFGVNRLKTTTEWISVCGFAPHAQKLVQNSQQMYDVVGKLRRVGDLALDAGMGFLDVSPDRISGFFDFVPVDGTLPIDRMAQATLWKEIMGSIRNMPPQVAMSYDWSRIFAWTAQLSGLKNINQFKVQVMPDQMLAGQAQAGNVIPMPGRAGLPPPNRPSPTGASPGNAAATAQGLNSMGSQE